MKRILVFLFVCIASYTSFSQNLVPNPSFENVTECPFALGLEDFTSDWVSGRASPDYFNTCSIADAAMVPNNFYGYQIPLIGDAYIGMLTYRYDTSIYTEAATAQLTSPLTTGQKYFISFRISLALDASTSSMAANNKMGIQFSKRAYSPSSPAPINNYAHLWTDSVITDSLNWMSIRGTFIADSNYTHLSLGNFFDFSQMDSVIYGDAFGAYYYFDDVCVSTDSTECFTTVVTEEVSPVNSWFSIYPNPAIEEINVEVNNLKLPYGLTIYNSLGQLLYEEDSILTNSKKVKISEFENGVLFIHIKTQSQFISYKLIKR